MLQTKLCVHGGDNLGPARSEHGTAQEKVAWPGRAGVSWGMGQVTAQLSAPPGRIWICTKLEVQALLGLVVER